MKIGRFPSVGGFLQFPSAGQDQRKGRFVMLKKWLLGVCAAFAFAVHSETYKGVPYTSSGDVKVNQWTSQINKAFSTAKSLNRPVLVALVSQECSHCERWISYSLNSSYWRNLLAEREAILLFIVRQTVGEANWYTYYTRYMNGTANGQFPGLAIYNPNGSAASILNQRSDWQATYINGKNFANWAKNYIPIPVRSSSVNLTAGTATIAENQSYTGTITYTKGAQNVSVSLSASDGGTISPSSLTLGAASGAGSSTFTYTPAKAADDAFTESYDVTITLSTSTASTYASLGTRTTVVTVKDQDVAMTLDEYKATDGNLASLKSASGTWYVDQGGVLRCVALSAENPEAVLEWTAPSAGHLDLSAVAYAGTGFTAKVGENEASATEIKTVGVSAGDVVTFTASAPAQEVEPEPESGLQSARRLAGDAPEESPYAGLDGGLVFTPLAGPSITSIPNGALIQLDDIKDDASVVDIALSEVEGAESYTVYASPDGSDYSEVELGGSNTVNAVEAGIVTSLEKAQGMIYLYAACGVSNAYDLAASEILVATGPVMSFAVVEKPVFNAGIPTYITAYVKLETSASFPAVSRQPMTYSISGAPSGIKIDNNGNLYGKPTRSGTFNAVVTASNASGGTTHPVTIVVKAANTLKEKCVGFVCDGDTLVGTVELKVTANGAVTAKLVAPAKVTRKGTAASSGGSLSFTSGNLRISRSGSGLWTGTYNGHTVVARKQGSGYTGTYVSTMESSGTAVAYALATVKSGGKASVKFMMPDAKQVSAQAKWIVLSAGEASSLGISMPGGAGSALFFPAYKSSSGRKTAHLCAVGAGAFAVRSGAWKGAFSATLAGNGAKYAKSFGVFSGRTLAVAKRNAGKVASGALSASASSVRFSSKNSGTITFKVKDGTYRAKVKAGSKKVSLKGVFVPSTRRTAAVGKSGSAYYFGTIEGN